MTETATGLMVIRQYCMDGIVSCIAIQWFAGNNGAT